jgi:hypothetical protein
VCYQSVTIFVNLGEYEGDLNIDDRILTDLIAACRAVEGKIDALPPILAK